MVEHLCRRLGATSLHLKFPVCGQVVAGRRHQPEDVEVRQGRPHLLSSSSGLDMAAFGMEGELGWAVSVANPHLVVFLRDK